MKQTTDNHTLADIQSLVKCPKNQFNKFGNYKYRSAEDIVDATKLVINPMGYWLIVTDEIVMVGDRIYVKAVATISNAQVSYSATGWAREEDSQKGMSGSQLTGATSSYARKYALNGLLSLDDTKDADFSNTHGKEVTVEDKHIKDALYKEWKPKIQEVTQLEDLISLFSNNKGIIEANIEIKKMFTTRKLELEKQLG